MRGARHLSQISPKWNSEQAMPIRLNCPCGAVLRVPDSAAGKKARCPACEALVAIPAPDEVQVELIDDEPNAQAAEPQPVGSTGMPCVVLIDDDPDLTTTVADMLTREDYRVEVARTGPEGLEMAQRLGPDLVVVDAVLPQTDGFELAKLVLNGAGPGSGSGGVPAVVMLTPRSSDEAEQRAKATGIQGHMRNPIYPAALCQLVAELVDERRQ